MVKWFKIIYYLIIVALAIFVFSLLDLHAKVGDIRDINRDIATKRCGKSIQRQSIAAMQAQNLEMNQKFNNLSQEKKDALQAEIARHKKAREDILGKELAQYFSDDALTGSGKCK
jgi:cell division protein FtsB